MSGENKTIFITGGAGFIGSNFIRYMLDKYSHYKIVNFDKLTYAGNPDNLVGIEDNQNYFFIEGDIAEAGHIEKHIKKSDWVVHFAAESHVDRSIIDPSEFIKTNVLGTYNLLESAKNNNVGKFVHVSTDEVYGSLGKDGLFTEDTPLAPNSPYSSSKAGSDLLARSYYETYGFPVVITRCSNNYGPYQFPEKLIPLMITNALSGIPLPVYGDGLNVRDWIHVDDHCRAVDAVLHNGRAGEVYNIGGNSEWANIDVVKLILKQLKKPESLIQFVEDRLGHDRRYAMDSSKMLKELGWSPEITFEDGIKQTIEWYVGHREWFNRIKTGEYRKR